MKRSWLLGLLSLAVVLLLLPAAAFADQQEVDNDVTSPGNQNTVSLTASPGATVTTTAQLVVWWSGNNHLAPGSPVLFLMDPVQTTAPSAQASPVILTIPATWNAKDQFVAGVSTVSFRAPSQAGSYVYSVKWKSPNDPGNSLTGAPALDIHLTVDSPAAPQPPADSTPPVITPTVTGTMGDGGWYTSDVSVTWSAVDNESGVSSTSGCDPTTLTADGVVTLTCSATSAGGTATQTVSVRLDKTAPLISANADRAANAAGWYNAPVTVSYACSDALSGVAACADQATLRDAGAAQSVTGTAADNAGNSASAAVNGINIDLTAPTTAVSAPTTWQNHDVPVTFAASDDLSGVGATYSTVDGGAPQPGAGLTVAAEGRHTVTYWSVDAAGNAEDARTAPVLVDKTAPVLSLPGDVAAIATSTAGAVVNYTASASDALSGLASFSCSTPSGSTFAPGKTLVTCTGTDAAGNTATGSFTVWVTYSLSCVMPPIPMSQNNTGRTVPVKCQLTGASAGITNLQARLYVTKLPGGTEVAAASTNSSTNLFRYDSTENLYIFNWTTKGLTAGTYQLRVDVGDGATNTYPITLK